MGRVRKIFNRCISPQASAIVAAKNADESLALMRRAEDAAEERQRSGDMFDTKPITINDLPDWIRKDKKLAERTLAALKARRKAGL